MSRISIELVPRFEGQFVEEMKVVKNEFPNVDTLNIPDILKFEMRIPEACDLAAPYFKNVIPHLRAVAVNKERPLPFLEHFKKNGITEVLVIYGDNPEIVSKSSNPCNSLDLIHKLKKEMPDIKIYAGLDPYRSSVEEELDYIHRKVEAGADGFFTNPYFDINLMESWIKKMPNTDVFWGLAPVIRESSRSYWENKNNIIFPDNFECTMEWNRNFVKEVLSFMEDTESHVYFMPITVDIIEYLQGLI